MAIRGASGAAVLVGGFACAQRVLGVSTGVGFITSTGALVDRVNGGFEQPNLLGGFLVMLFPLALVGTVVDRRFRVLHLLAAALAFGGIYASFSRGALVAMAIVPFVLVRGRWLVVLVPLAVVVAGVAVPGVIAERFAVGGGDGAELAGRRDIWSAAGAIWLERPLLGTGLGGFPGSYATARVVGKQFLPDTRFEPPPHAHNLELQLLAEQGLLGFTAFAMVAGRAVWDALTVRRSARHVESLLAAGLLASLAAMLVHNLFDVTLVENGGIELWGILGILSALVSVARTGEIADVA
jgi:O-antigen ligase